MNEITQNIIWTSPQGNEFELFCTNTPGYTKKHIGEVKQNPINTDKNSKIKTKKIENSNDTFQDMGVGGSDIDLEFVFINNQAEADRFEKALCEVGKSLLKIAYKKTQTVNVLEYSIEFPTVKSINLCKIKVKFHEVSANKYPVKELKSQRLIHEKADEVLNLSSKDFENIANSIDLSDSARVLAFKDNFNNALSEVENFIDMTDSDIAAIFEDIAGQDVLVNAFTIAKQVQYLINKGINTAKNLSQNAPVLQKIKSFSDFLDIFKSKNDLIYNNKTVAKTNKSDSLHIYDLFAVSVINSAAKALVNTDFETRKQAVAAAQNIVKAEQKWTEYIQEKQKDINAEIFKNNTDVYVRDFDTGNVVLQTAEFLTENSYNLKIEKRIYLAENTPLLLFALNNYNLKDNPDKVIEEIIKSNNLCADEIFMLPKGREILMYV